MRMCNEEKDPLPVDLPNEMKREKITKFEGKSPPREGKFFFQEIAEPVLSCIY